MAQSKANFEAATLAELQEKERAWREAHPEIRELKYLRTDDAVTTGVRFGSKPLSKNAHFSSTIEYEDSN